MHNEIACHNHSTRPPSAYYDGLTAHSDEGLHPMNSPDVTTVCEVLRQRNYLYTNEIELHEQLSTALHDAHINHTREAHLAAGRIDFLLPGGLGIEVKVKGHTAAVQRQLHRYARDPHITHLLLITTRREHRAITRDAAGIPIRVLSIGGFSL